MAWKTATSFVLTAETWLGAEKTRSGDEALLAVGVSRHERLALLQRIRRGDAVSFSEPMWLAPHHVDDQYFAKAWKCAINHSLQQLGREARQGRLPIKLDS